MGPITLGLHIGLVLALLSVLFTKSQGSQYAALALVVSFIGAKVATILGNPLYLAPFMAIAFLYSLGWRNVYGYIVAGIYALRTAWAGLFSFTGWETQVFWNINNEALLSIQILACIVGGFHGGYGYRGHPWGVSSLDIFPNGMDFAKNRSNQSDKGGDNRTIKKSEKLTG